MHACMAMFSLLALRVWILSVHYQLSVLCQYLVYHNTASSLSSLVGIHNTSKATSIHNINDKGASACLLHKLK